MAIDNAQRLVTTEVGEPVNTRFPDHQRAAARPRDAAG
jgi:hypothetical protein